MSARSALTDEGLARLALSALGEPGDPVIAGLVADHGPCLALDRIRGGSADSERYAARSAVLDVPRLLDIAAIVGARLVVPGDAEWPEGVDDLAAPPLVLWVKGTADLTELRRRGVAVVGSRACTAYGEREASDLASALTERGFVVVSGAAFGIDAAAHRGALAVGGPTVAVLACGIDRVYPAAHRELIAAIADQGAVVSESPPGSAPMRQRFLSRNRLIATMTAATVVVEAGLRSGALNTTRTADDYGRLVGAYPGSVQSAASAGCHQAIRDQRAVLVTRAAEVVDLVGSLGTDACERPSAPVGVADDLDPLTSAVWGALPYRRAILPSVLAGIAGLGLRDITAALGVLELRGLAVRAGEGWRKSPQRSGTLPVG